MLNNMILELFIVIMYKKNGKMSIMLIFKYIGNRLIVIEVVIGNILVLYVKGLDGNV